MSTSNHSWNAGDRPALKVTPSGIQLLAYMDYVTVHNFVSLAPADTSAPVPKKPTHPDLEELYRQKERAQADYDHDFRYGSDEEFERSKTRLHELRNQIFEIEFAMPEPPEAPPEQYDDDRQPPERKDVTPHVDDLDFDLTDDDDDGYGARGDLERPSDDGSWANGGEDIDDLYDEEED